jgi:hypothetical protein
MAKLAPGTIVSYVLPRGPARGQQRPAILVNHHDNEGAGTADLWLFGNPTSDGPEFGGPSPIFIGGVGRDNLKAPNTWS